MNELNRRLLQDERTEDLFRSIQDTEYQKKLMDEYGLEDKLQKYNQKGMPS